ncbi:MAG: gliding motility-associated C-terminal domain-containing protein [Flavobacteriales bacterium]|nr:gliding motility-associated C-terminal domain-containing protein [Flavobacteriales bacterium]
MNANRIGSCLLFMTLAAWTVPCRAQSCDDPLTLCPEEPTPVFITDGAFLNFDCIDATHVAVLKFRSNHNFEDPGNARIRISQVNCEGATGPDTLSAVVVSAAGDPCDFSVLTSMGPCVTGTDDLVWESSTLMHDTEYFLLIGAVHDPSDTLCAMYVELEGDGVTMDACCNHTLVSGASAQLEVVGGDPVYGYTWSPSFYLSDTDQAITTVTPAETISYQVDGVIGDCQVSSSVTVTVGSPIGVPNSFTPNADGINDFWGIDGIGAFPGAQIEVFNRWGQLVHRSLGYAQPWDGTGRSGKPLNEGTYYYVIELNDETLPIPPETGHVAIIR